MVAKFLKYKGPVINDVTDTGTTYTVYSPGQLYLSKNLVDLGDGFYRDKTLPYENAVSKVVNCFHFVSLLC